MKDTITDPLPKTIREFKYMWLKDQFLSYSDAEIKELLLKILNNDKTHLTINL